MNNEIRTSDLYFAAFLQCAGCKTIKTEREGSKFIFFFEDPQNRESLKNDYFNEDEKSNIPALKYANAVRNLKTLCYVKN